MQEFKVGSEPYVPPTPDPGIGSRDRFTGGDTKRREEAAEEYAESTRRAQEKDTKD